MWSLAQLPLVPIKVGPAHCHPEHSCKRDPTDSASAATWGKGWKSALVLLQCNNKAVVEVLQSQYSWNLILMHLLRCVFFMEANYQFQSMAQHVQGCLNMAADAISCNQMSTFLQLPAANSHPLPLSPRMVDQLADMMAK